MGDLDIGQELSGLPNARMLDYNARNDAREVCEKDIQIADTCEVCEICACEREASGFYPIVYDERIRLIIHKDFPDQPDTIAARLRIQQLLRIKLRSLCHYGCTPEGRRFTSMALM